jgi:hypothetical protein
MLTDQRRVILEHLARGELSPDDAERQLAALDTQDAQGAPPGPPAPPAAPRLPDPPAPPAAPRLPDPPVPPAPPPPAPSPATPTDHDAPPATVHATLNGPGMVEVEGDDSTREVRVDGPNTCEIGRDGDTVLVNGNLGEEGLVVVPSRTHLHLEANSPELSVAGLLGPLSGVLNVAEARVTGLYAEGHHEIEAHVGELHLTLQPGSDVTLVVRCVAHLDVDPALTKVGRGEWVLGDGTATLTVTGSAGEVWVSVA